VNLPNRYRLRRVALSIPWGTPTRLPPTPPKGEGETRVAQALLAGKEGEPQVRECFCDVAFPQKRGTCYTMQAAFTIGYLTQHPVPGPTAARACFRATVRASPAAVASLLPLSQRAACELSGVGVTARQPSSHGAPPALDGVHEYTYLSVEHTRAWGPVSEEAASAGSIQGAASVVIIPHIPSDVVSAALQCPPADVLACADDTSETLTARLGASSFLDDAHVLNIQQGQRQTRSERAEAAPVERDAVPCTTAFERRHTAAKRCLPCDGDVTHWSRADALGRIKGLWNAPARRGGG
jgi:hypothetical protein